MNKVRRIAAERSVGHLGTLDPIATGVLPLLIGPATRLARFHAAADKLYRACIRFGFATTTYDSEGEPSTGPVPITLEPSALQQALQSFRGRIQQIPPRFSAKKVAGVPAYKLARRNQEVQLSPVEVEIYSIDLVRAVGSEAEIIVHCSAGTYIRSLAHDLGSLLGCGAHLSALRRLRSGGFTIEQASTLEDLAGNLASALIPAAALLPEFPTVVADENTAAQIHHGRDFPGNPFLIRPGVKHVKAVGPTGELIAIGEAILPNLFHPVVVLA